MRIINTFDKIPGCFKNSAFDLDAWRVYARAISPELGEKCERDSREYDFNNDVLPVVNNVLLNRDAAIAANDSFVAVTDKLASNIERLFENGVETDIILYLGLCNGAGWATALDGRDAVLLGIEKIIELNWQDESAMQALIFHEIGHIWHKTYGNLYPEARSEGENSPAQLYQEGLAMVCEHILCQDDRYYHQNQNGWLDWCKENEAEIKREYLRRVDKNISTQDFFGDWCSYKNHSDVGYYLGCEFVKYLQRQYSLVDIASLNVNQLYNHFKEFASTE